jgi:pimeloyl-ACP methyl ester carboxylesterase
MSEEFTTVGTTGVELCYETFGDPADPTLLLIMGLATQMIAWREEFCEGLAARGFHVVRFDNRDVGRSGHIDGPTPSLPQLLTRSPKGAPYLLGDMAADAAGLLDHLGVERAHVAGASMGGMIGQTLAARYADRVLSLTSIMSNTGHRWSGQPALGVYPVLLKTAPRERDAFVEHIVKTYGAIGSTGFDGDDSDLREIAGRSYDRGLDPRGTARQMWAIVASGDRTKELGTITAPTLVIHGTADKLVSPSGGRATRKAIPGARLVTIEGMGHDLPRALWPRYTSLIAEHAHSADAAKEASQPV